MTPAAILRAAAGNVHPETWCQGQYQTRDGRGCAVWHLEQVGQGHGPATTTAKHALYDVIGVCGLADWNDDPDRTSFDVVELFEQVAAKLEAQ